MKLSSWLVALVMSFGIMAPAGAAVISGSVGDLSYFGDLSKPKGAFVDTYTFTLDSTSDVSGMFVSKGIKGLDYTLESGDFSVGGSIKGFVNFFSFSSLASGIYELTISGFAKKEAGYFGLFTVAAVPEVETWAMLGIGGLLLSWQLKRRRRAEAKTDTGLALPA